MFSSEFCEIFKNICFEEHLRTADSEDIKISNLTSKLWKMFIDLQNEHIQKFFLLKSNMKNNHYDYVINKLLRYLNLVYYN